MRRFLAVSLALGIALVATPRASAHAVLTDSFPRFKSVVNTMPTKVWIEFDGNLTQIAGKKINFINLTDSKGKLIPTVNEYVGGARLTAELASSNLEGRVTISWRVVSEDGHPVSGSIYFTVLKKKMGK